MSVPKELVAVMSAIGDGQEVDAEDSSRISYRFKQPVGRRPADGCVTSFPR